MSWRLSQIPHAHRCFSSSVHSINQSIYLSSLLSIPKRRVKGLNLLSSATVERRIVLLSKIAFKYDLSCVLQQGNAQLLQQGLIRVHYQRLTPGNSGHHPQASASTRSLRDNFDFHMVI
jgi:hypothetical protein